MWVQDCHYHYLQWELTNVNIEVSSADDRQCWPLSSSVHWTVLPVAPTAWCLSCEPSSYCRSMLVQLWPYLYSSSLWILLYNVILSSYMYKWTMYINICYCVCCSPSPPLVCQTTSWSSSTASSMDLSIREQWCYHNVIGPPLSNTLLSIELAQWVLMSQH